MITHAEFFEKVKVSEEERVKAVEAETDIFLQSVLEKGFSYDKVYPVEGDISHIIEALNDRGFCVCSRELGQRGPSGIVFIFSLPSRATK
jgi:hypothetical protein